MQALHIFQSPPPPSLPITNKALRAPLEELKSREDRQRRKKEAAAAGRGNAGTASVAFPGASSTSFGASLFAMTSSGRDANGGVGRGGGRRTSAKTAGGGGGSGEQGHEDVMAVVEQVRKAVGYARFSLRLFLFFVFWFGGCTWESGGGKCCHAVRFGMHGVRLFRAQKGDVIFYSTVLCAMQF